MQPVKDASHLYEVERRAKHAERPGFKITELQIGPTQKVPWHCHTNVQDTFYVLEGRLRIFLRDPKEDVTLGPSETYAVRPGRAHLVTNAGSTSATFLVLQGIGEYDYVDLTDMGGLATGPPSPPGRSAAPRETRGAPRQAAA
jgi:mannose-6-phosphate isomerase-like protein (cupin superfamily)